MHLTCIFIDASVRKDILKMGRDMCEMNPLQIMKKKSFADSVIFKPFFTFPVTVLVSHVILLITNTKVYN